MFIPFDKLGWPDFLVVLNKLHVRKQKILEHYQLYAFLGISYSPAQFEACSTSLGGDTKVFLGRNARSVYFKFAIIFLPQTEHSNYHLKITYVALHGQEDVPSKTGININSIKQLQAGLAYAVEDWHIKKFLLVLPSHYSINGACFIISHHIQQLAHLLLSAHSELTRTNAG